MAGDRSPALPSGASRAAAPGPIGPLVDVSMRLLVHLGYQPAATNGAAAAVGSTQRGMERDLGVSQGAISKVLDRLVAVGVVRYERGHVVGEPRRQRVYRLTERGEAIARRIRSRFGLPEYPPRGGWSLDRESGAGDASTDRARTTPDARP